MDTKKNDRSPWQEAAQLLPKEAGSELVYTVLNDIYDAGLLGPDLLLFQRQGVEVAEDIARTMSPEDWDRRERGAAGVLNVPVPPAGMTLLPGISERTASGALL